MKCEDCIFWCPNPDTEKNECHRNAPTMLSGSGTGWSDQLWPHTKSYDWCGEFQSKGE